MSILKSLTAENGTGWNAMQANLSQRAAQVQQDREQRQLALQRQREQQHRQRILEEVPTILEGVFTAMAEKTADGIMEAQRLLGDRNSSDPLDKIRMEVIHECLCERIYEDRKRREGSLYQRLHDFLNAALNGLPYAQQLEQAAAEEDPEAMLRAMQYSPGNDKVTGDKTLHNSCAAAVALLLMEEPWSPKVWVIHGFDQLRHFCLRAQALLRQRREIAELEEQYVREEQGGAPQAEESALAVA